MLQDAQVDILYIVFYKQKDLLLFAKTSFGKSFIFQILSFMYNLTNIVIILMPLKLFLGE